MSRVLVCLVFCVGLAACHGAKSPELRVIGVHETPRQEVVFVQVRNPASRPMRLTKLEYTFAAASGKVTQGEVALSRDVPAGAAVVVEIPLDNIPDETPVTLSGKLTAEQDQVSRTFNVKAEVKPEAPAKPAEAPPPPPANEEPAPQEPPPPAPPSNDEPKPPEPDETGYRGVPPTYTNE
jgi:hypothetical protein